MLIETERVKLLNRKMIMFKKIIIGLLVVVISMPVMADETSHRKSVEEMMQLLNMKKTMNSSFEITFLAGIKSLERKFECIDSKVSDKVLKAVRSEINLYEGTKEQLIQLYVDEFTEAEIRAVIKFYKTPIAKKFVTKQSELMQKGATIGQQYVQGKSMNIQKAVSGVVDQYLNKNGTCKAKKEK